jgi:hypothetical protein
VQVVEKIIVIVVNHSQQHRKKGVGHLILQSRHILGPQTFTKRMTRCSRCFFEDMVFNICIRYFTKNNYMDKKIKFKERQEWEKACIENEM